MLVNMAIVLVVFVAPLTVFKLGYWFTNGGVRQHGSHE